MIKGNLHSLIMNEFFEGKFSVFWISQHYIINDRVEQISLERVQQLLKRFHGQFEEVKDWSVTIDRASAQTDDEIADGSNRQGFTEGIVKYTVVHRDGAEEEISGPFRVLMQYRYSCWKAVHFRVPRFSW